MLLYDYNLGQHWCHSHRCGIAKVQWAQRGWHRCEPSPTLKQSPSNSRIHNVLIFSFFVQQPCFWSFYSQPHQTLYSSTFFYFVTWPAVGFRVITTCSWNSANVSTSYNVCGSGCRRVSTQRRFDGIDLLTWSKINDRAIGWVQGDWHRNLSTREIYMSMILLLGIKQGFSSSSL